jgi:hypothetical protein
VEAGHWYKFVVAVTNTSGASGNVSASCELYDYGTDGLTPSANLITFSTVSSHAAQNIATNTAVWPALRAFEDGGISAWDNFLVFQSNSPPIITLDLTNSAVALGAPATFNALADGPGTITYVWYTNNILASGATGAAYTTPPVSSGFTNVTVVAQNANGSVTNSAIVSEFVAGLPQIESAPATDVQTSSATLGGQVLSTGGVTTTVNLYYGTANAGTNAAGWDNSIALGAETGTFSQAIAGLSPDMTYYYTVNAVNFAGTSWVTPSRRFTTLAVTLPQVTNAPATAISTSQATLNGQVLSTGGGPTSVILYYGPADGGTDAGSWAQNVPLGAQTGVFSQTVALSIGTTYFFTAQASNSAGVAWATPSLSFTTLDIMTPISLTGFNSDLVIESNAVGPPYNNYAVEFNPGEGTCYYQQGLPGTSYGLPASGSFNSVIDGTLFEFQPYTTNNALVMSSDTGLTNGTLTLVNPATYNGIAILANSASAESTSTGALTLNFADGTTYSTNFDAADWFFNPGFALQGVDRINIEDGATDGGPTDPRFYQTSLNLIEILGATNKPIASFTFGEAAGVGATAVYAVSGYLSASNTFTLATVTNLAATGIQPTAATFNGQVLTTGGFAPTITLYYGPANGGTNAGSWANSITLGVETATYSQAITGLSPDTLYHDHRHIAASGQ